jgi:hypothetical protein
MSLTTAEEVYEQIVRLLPAAERLRLVEKIAHELSTPLVENGSSNHHDREALPGSEVDSPAQRIKSKEALQRMVVVSEEMGLYDE